MARARRNDPEHILCAAIYVDTGKAEPARRSYTYPKTGLVFAGWRHSDCFTALHAWSGLLSEEAKAAIEEVTPHQLLGKNQGFLTSTGRYVDRAEAQRIALAAGQVAAGSCSQKVPGDLFSEDLY